MRGTLLGRVAFLSIVMASVPAMRVRAQDQCNLAKDLVVQALERVKTGSNEEAGDSLQLLKHATEVCINSGDAWYYRYVFEKKLGQASKADYSLKKARLFTSEAMELGSDPFVLATGHTGIPAPGPVHEKWALVVGISKFQDPRLHRLNFASKDAKDFAALLVDPKVGRFKPSNVHALTDGANATSVDRSASSGELDRIRQGVGRAIVTSSSPEEQSYEGKPYTNGYFTYFLMEAMKKNNGQSSIDQIYDDLKQNVSKAASSIQRKQNPVLSQSEHGSAIVIGAPAEVLAAGG